MSGSRGGGRRRHGRPTVAQRPRGGPLVAGSEVGPRPDQAEHGADTPAGRQLGLDDREIPGGRTHLVNPESPGTRPKEGKAGDLFGGMNAHGVIDALAEPGYEVPSTHTGPAPRPAPEQEMLDAVPVYVVQEPGRKRVGRVTAMDSITVVKSTANEPSRVCNVDPRRVNIRILNEDTATDIRVSNSRTDLLSNKGALLSHYLNSFTTLETQDELFAMTTSASNTALLSIIITTETDM